MEKEEMLELIKKADEAYYMDDNPIITDAEYDKLRYDFIAKYGELNYVPGGVKKGLEPFKHPTEVISLDKVKADEDDRLLAKIKKLLPVCIQRKYDGLTLVIYGDKVVTRGNGFEGEVVKHFPSKYSLAENKSKYPVRGELILPYSAFERVNKQRVQEGLPKYKNPRNAAAGIIRSIERSPYLDELEFYAYDLIDCPLKTSDKINYLAHHTELDVTENASFTDAQAAVKYIKEKFQQYNEEDTPIDGMVIKSNIEDSLKKFGTTAHHPLDAFAWKPFQDGVETILRDVKWQVGKNQITAVAYFDTVKIDGTDVSQASLSNIGIIRRLGLTIGAKILVSKANQIIPQIVQVLADGYKVIEYPTHCPVCGHKTVINNNVLYCVNKECKARLLNNIAYMASKSVLNIKGLSKATIAKLIDKGVIKTKNDIFKVGYEDLIELEGFGDISANKIAEAINACKYNVDLAHFISACCVQNIGKEVGTILMKKFKTSDRLKESLGHYSFHSLDGIGFTTDEILNSKEFIQAYNNLLEYITPIEYTENTVYKGTVVITGKLSKSRDYFKMLLESIGYKVTNSVSKNTTFLLCGDVNSTKAKKAKALGVKILTEIDIQENQI